MGENVKFFLQAKCFLVFIEVFRDNEIQRSKHKSLKVILGNIVTLDFILKSGKRSTVMDFFW